MEAKKVTPEQLGQLFVFTRQHFVEYHDLQAELADHLANAIEERWQKQPGLTFNEALQLEFRKFGIFGFSDIVEQRQNALFKKYYRLVWEEFLSVFNFRLVLFMVLGIFATYKAVMAFPGTYAVLLLLFLCVSSWKLWQLKLQYKKKRELTGKKWLFEEIIYTCGGFGVIMTLPLQLSQFVMHNALPSLLAMIMAVVLVLLFVYDYVALFRMPARAEKHLWKVYPEYGMENLV